MRKERHVVVGILAHVDAGKTTLAESVLYMAGKLRRLGRVDHKDAFLDNYALERERGITIFSKQAEFTWKELGITLLDTPGHVDFSAEMERTLQVLDYAVLVISGTDGVQSHTRTLWHLLKEYEIPTFVFVNKMDMAGADKTSVLQALTRELDSMCVDFASDDYEEMAAMGDESALEYYLEQGCLTPEHLQKLIGERKVFPCYFGSALKVEGVDTFLDGLHSYMVSNIYPPEFGAKVFKVSRDEQGNRLTHMKITGGSLKVKATLSVKGEQEKADQLRLYSGTKYELLEEVKAGRVCAVKGLENAMPGDGLGIEKRTGLPVLEPVLDYRMLLPDGVDPFVFLKQLRQLEQEDPTLHIDWKEATAEIHLRLMGLVQIEIMKHMIAERFGIEVEFDAGSIMYKETIASPVEGVGHYEPLKHYAEVHLLMEPLPQGSGLIFETDCKEDDLDRNWQRLIFTHLREKEHVGVLTGAPITDMKITVIAGRAHMKHTEGGDFRQATYRAVRHGLKRAKSVLLEPVYQFRLELPSANLGRAMTDIEQMHGSFEPPELDGDRALLVGRAPVITMQNYQSEVASYTKGEGRCMLTLAGYAPCHNAEEVLAASVYDSEEDLENPTGSVFCAHGGGYLVPWYEVENHMHVTRGYIPALDGEKPTQQDETAVNHARRFREPDGRGRDTVMDDKELEAIFNQAFPSARNVNKKYANTSKALGYEQVKSTYKPKPKLPECLLVDGYNVIYAWENLAELAKVNLEAARNELMDILCNYQGFRDCMVILVFDAYRVKGNPGEVLQYRNIYVVYTKEAETADMYIERTTHEKGKDYDITVATSDALEQLIVMGQGAKRMSSRELREVIERTIEENMGRYRDRTAEDIKAFQKDKENIFEQD